MAIIPKNDPIDHKLNHEVVTQELRGHLGLSMIGEECRRKLQYNHYWAFKGEYNTRIARLFQVGHDAEAGMIADLNKVGITVFDEQKEIRGTAGHWMGHIDGKGAHLKPNGTLVSEEDDDDFLVEFKTHNDASFKDMKKKKVLLSKPMHYGQCQTYMGHLVLDKALYMALNKNTSEIYIEWVDFDEDYFKESKRKEIDVISADTLLPRVGTGRPTWFACKTCSAKDACFKGRIEQNCRTCQHVDVLDDGKWACNYYKLASEDNVLLSEKEQRTGCPSYTRGEMFNG
jgi:hypothetical protein